MEAAGQHTTSSGRIAGNKKTAGRVDSNSINDRLGYLILLNKANAVRRSIYRTDRERLEAAMMFEPIPMEAAYARFGLLLGLFPTTAIFFQMFGDIRYVNFSPLLLSLFVLAIAGTSAAGFLTGKAAARAARRAFDQRLTVALSIIPLIGLAWGVVSGIAGGSFIFGIGAFFGLAIGALIGVTVVPVFAILHQLVRRGDLIEQKHFLPIAFGLSLAVSAFILGL